jgi:hypothetical protein
MRPQNPTTASHLVSFSRARPLATGISALGSFKLVARMLWASRHGGDQWLIIVSQAEICSSTPRRSKLRLLNRERPPLMPSAPATGQSRGTGMRDHYIKPSDAQFIRLFR